MGISYLKHLLRDKTISRSTQKMAFFKVLMGAAMVACATAAPAAPAPYHAPAPAPYHEPIAAPVYNFQYGVSDSYSGAAFSHSEDRNNYDTKGEYRVNLPDGRVQIVTYSAGPDGYVADVKYEGEAAYPEYKPAAHPAPAYKPHPAPAYKPLPKPAYKPVPAPVYHKPAQAHPAPVYHKPAVYHPAPAYKPKPRYSFAVVTEAPAAEAAPAEEARSSPAEESAAPVVAVEEAAAPAAAAPAAEEARYYF